MKFVLLVLLSYEMWVGISGMQLGVRMHPRKDSRSTLWDAIGDALNGLNIANGP